MAIQHVSFKVQGILSVKGKIVVVTGGGTWKCFFGYRLSVDYVFTRFLPWISK